MGRSVPGISTDRVSELLLSTWLALHGISPVTKSSESDGGVGWMDSLSSVQRTPKRRHVVATTQTDAGVKIVPSELFVGFSVDSGPRTPHKLAQHSGSAVGDLMDRRHFWHLITTHVLCFPSISAWRHKHARHAAIIKIRRQRCVVAKDVQAWYHRSVILGQALSSSVDE
ncbi:hypothetical protein SODALDRAFT_142823 [Sodiomyces alkalinus F11]|uniref:Uncharacterized protein n=1 Tax=Sodiomyces alkalinus (strain CBS 110278 / VKM F-3762 / F11) TaxID=1314773 RepID=A0A3N2PZN2_SODAK|nr:hypothetical protein SODALDRAFT_142823 [Sodiomyces alkalinus F11]ROT39974.1 hypothetical protein SODALDRAFT_142823 [Sodiomyces alkalinus F11]